MFSFTITSLMLTLIPGPGLIYTISTGVAYGRSKSILAVIGCTLGIIPHLLVGVLGVTLFTNLPQEIIALIQSIGASYLIYLGYQLIFKKASLKLNTPSKPLANHTYIVQPILVNLLNPKLSLFFLSFLPQYINETHNPVRQTIQLGTIFMMITFLVFLVYGILSAHMGKLLTTRPTYILNFQRFVGLAFIGYAASIAFDALSVLSL